MMMKVKASVDVDTGSERIPEHVKLPDHFEDKDDDDDDEEEEEEAAGAEEPAQLSQVQCLSCVVI